MKFPINMQIRSTSICFDSSVIIIIYIFPPFSSPARSNPAKVLRVSRDVKAAHFLLLSTRLTDPLGSLCCCQSDVSGLFVSSVHFLWKIFDIIV